MSKIDIISLTGLTAVDGSVVTSGATIKFGSVFYSGSNQVKITPLVYRSRELFEMGYSSVRVSTIPYEFNLNIPNEEFYVMTPQILYEKVKNELNDLLGGECFDVQIINETEE